MSKIWSGMNGWMDGWYEWMDGTKYVAKVELDFFNFYFYLYFSFLSLPAVLIFCLIIDA